MTTASEILAQAANRLAENNAISPKVEPQSAWTPPNIPYTPAEQKMAGLDNVSGDKMASVAATSDAKKAAMSPMDYFNNAVAASTGQGRESATQLERDLQDMNPLQVLERYGEDEGTRLVLGQAAGQTALTKANTRGARTPTEIWDDFNVDFGQGLAGAIGGLGALGLGAVSDTAGTAAARGLGELNAFLDESKSPRLQARKRVQEAKEQLDSRDTAAQRVKDIAAGDGDVVAGLKKFGRDVLNSLDNATDDSATFGSGVSNALGSFVAAGPVARGLSAATGGVLGTTAAIAATEAGGSYSQVTDAVLQQPHEQLMRESQLYRTLIAQGESQEDAKAAVANSTGLTAAALTAPAAAAAGRLVHRFEGNIAGLGSGRQLAGNIARETTEESLQSGFGQFAQNVAEQQIANDSKDLTEGVGRATAEGGLYGMGMSTALGIPSVVRDAATAAGKTVATAFNDRLAGIEEANKASSAVSDTVVAQAAAEAQAAAPVAEQVLRDAVSAAPIEQQEAGNAYVDRLMTASQYDPSEAPAAFNGMFDDVTTRTGAIQRMAEIVNSAEEGSNDQLRAGFALYDLISDYAAVINQDPEALSALPADNQAAKVVAQYQDLMGAIENSPKVVSAVEQVMSLIQSSEAKQVDVTEQSVATPEGQQDVADVLSTAELAPEKVDLPTAEKILYQIQQGNLTVSPRQKAALDSSVAILRAVQEADKAAVAAGVADPVSLNISSVDSEKGKSLTQHAKGIMSAWKAGDLDLAADRLVDLRNFAQGMSNKVGALNAHFAAGNPNADGLNYEVFVGGQPVTSKAKVATRTGNQGGIQFAQKVAREAKLLADVYNGLATAFPDLQAEHLAVTPLANELVGVPAEVVARLKPVAAPVAEVKDTPAPQAAPAPKKESPSSVTSATEKVQKTQAPAEPVVESTPVEEPVVSEPTPTLKGTAAAFPQLVGGQDNLFARNFKLPKEQRTRTIGEESPVKVVSDILKNSATLTAALGKAPQGEYSTPIAKAYKTLLGYAPDFISSLDDSLQNFLEKGSNQSKFEEGEANRWVNGKLLNIADVVDGEYVLNPELAENAVLAGLQWFLSSDQYGSVSDAKDISEMLGMSEGTAPEGALEDLNRGMSKDDAVRSLAQKIANYWGVSNDPTGSIGYQEGIPLAAAAELMDILIAGKWVNVETYTYTEADGLPPLDNGKPNVKSFNRYVPSKADGSPLHKDSVLNAFPDAIEHAVMLNPEETQYVGDVTLPVADTQLRNNSVPLTEQQLDMVKNEQATPYYVNPVMAGFYRALGMDNVIALFGSGVFDKKTTNKNHAQSMDGVNRSTVSAFDHLFSTLDRIQNVGDLATTPIRYPVRITRVNRAHLQGKYNPQANKLVREAILPNWATLDLSSQTSQDYRRFMLGVAQMIGEKVHNMSPAASRAKAEAKLLGDLAPAVEALSNWNIGFKGDMNVEPMDQGTVDTIAASFKAAGVGMTPMALHAVMEYARLQVTDNKSAFRTAAYVEADGMTNGPINAMVLFATGLFNGRWIRNIAKGGLFINQPGMTANHFREHLDKVDLYEETTGELDQNLKGLRDVLAGDAAATEQLDSMLKLMDLFFGKDLSFKDGVLTLQRGIAKNPLTITIYGSGAAGIAAKMTKVLVDAMYERMSQVADARASGENSMAIAMFGPQSTSVEDARAKAQTFITAYNNMTQKSVGVKKDGGFYVRSNRPEKTGDLRDPVNFTVSTEEMANMRSTMLHFFVTPMRDAINNTVGDEVLGTAELIRMTTQAQSIVMEHAFRAEVEAAVAEKAKDPNWRKGDFLSRPEMDAIHKKLGHMSPLVQTGTQNFYIAGSQNANVDAPQFASSFGGKTRMDAYIDGPANASVSGIPFLNIGSGDGQMMQNISVAPNAPTGTLKIFDGMNMPLDQIETGSEVANKAVMDSWVANPLAAVYKSYSQFVSDTKLTGMSDAMRLDLSKALFGLKSEAQPEADVIDAMTQLVDQLNVAQLDIEARHNVLSRVNLSVDQMAAVGSPFTQEGELPLTGTDPESLAAQLNVYYLTERAKLAGQQSTGSISADIDTLFTEHPSGAKVLSSADLSKLSTVFSDEQAAVMKNVVGTLDGYTIVHGTPEQVAAYDRTEGMSNAGVSPTGEVHGYTNTSTQTVYLLNPSAETFVHELVHAATFDALNAHYNGVTDSRVSGAVKRLEALQADMLNQGDTLTQTSGTLNQSFNNMAAAVRGHEQAGRKAEALNEFMAWTLANEQLARVAQRTSASRLARVRDAIVDAVKALFGIKAPGQDVFSNLLFNSAIVAQSQPSLAQRFKASVLFQNSIYGTDDRLTAVNQALDATIGRYLQTPPQAGVVDAQDALKTGIQNAYRVAQAFMANGFPMNMQEASTFNIIVTALSTEAALDRNAMAGVQQLYAHVMKNLSVESFMVNPESNDPNDRAQAIEKFDVLSGKNLVTRDLLGRSSLLPAFLALATVHPAFRSVLEGMDLPKSSGNTAGTLDALLENTGNNLMERLGRSMAGTTKAKNVQQAIDLMNAQMADVINQRETFIDTMASNTAGVVGRTNDAVVAGMEWLADKAMQTAKKTQRNAAGRLERAAGGIVAGFAALIDDHTAGAVSQATMASINKTNMWNAAHTMINDLVGRTESNAGVYDLIKTTRSFVQRVRQQYRENLPAKLASEFTRQLTSEEKASLFRSMGKTDLAALGKDALKQVADLSGSISALETDLQNTQHWSLIQKKAKELATYMVTGQPSRNLLRNAEAVARLPGEGVKVNGLADIAKLDKLISLYAVDMLSQEDKDTLNNLATDEAKGMEFAVSYLRGQRAEEMSKATGMAKMNAFKGYIPGQRNEGASILVANDSEHARLLGMGYQRVDDYVGSSLERGLSRSYFHIPVASRATFEQGIMQNVRQSSNGVDPATGYMYGQNAGRITEAADVKLLARRQSRETGPEFLLPVYDQGGNVVAFERSMAPAMLAKVEGDQDLLESIGQWRGRQVEEAFAQDFNSVLIDRLGDMYDKDIAENAGNKDQYVDLLKVSDPVLRDAVKLMSPEMQEAMANRFGTEFWVRKDMLNDVLGYRAASIGDAWTGNSRWSPETQKAVRNMAVAAFGNNAYKNLLIAERSVQAVVADAKSLIVVKSVIVPMVNFISNMYQLASNGVSPIKAAKALPSKLAEVEAYTRSLVRKIEAEAELRAASTPQSERKLKAEIQAIDDSHKRMSIWPLIEAGEFSGIADQGITNADIEMASGRMQAYMESLVNKLPTAGRTLGRYALITKDTALYQGLQKSVEYGDFLAKAILYDDKLSKGNTKSEALSWITEEFVNYDRLPGRFRGTLENLGLLWFYNFKIRSVKVALRSIRRNPVYTLMAALAPTPDLFGTVGLPIHDNMFSKLADGTLDYSVGPGQGLNAAMLNPWINLTQ